MKRSWFTKFRIFSMPGEDDVGEFVRDVRGRYRPSTYVRWDSMYALLDVQQRKSTKGVHTMRYFLVASVIVLSAGVSLAVPVDANAVSGIAAMYALPSTDVNLIHVWALCTDGMLYVTSYGLAQVAPPSSWHLRGPVPVAVAEIQDFSGNSFVTVDGRLFVLGWNNTDLVWAEWSAIPGMPQVPCGGAVPVDAGAFGRLKSQFRQMAHQFP